MIPAVILAAGESRRMGNIKPLLPLGNGSVIEHVIAAHRAAGLHSILVVAGHAWPGIARALRPVGVDLVINHRYREGMLSSAVAAVQFLARGCPPAGVLFSLADLPRLTPEVIRFVSQAFLDRPDRIVMPSVRGRKGHPIVFPWSIARDLPGYQGPDGLRGLRDLHRDRILEMPVDDEGILLDLDTPEDYQALVGRPNG
ncbi:MAG: nucleotidyltransferase family protein [Planctomycetes bacterium]|nr:nucleotidyltransferase family protein [Planctomycetota bacterium]